MSGLATAYAPVITVDGTWEVLLQAGSMQVATELYLYKISWSYALLQNIDEDITEVTVSTPVTVEYIGSPPILRPPKGIS